MNKQDRKVYLKLWLITLGLVACMPIGGILGTTVWEGFLVLCVAPFIGVIVAILLMYDAI